MICLQVWNACKPNVDDSDQPNHEIDVLTGHENDVNYVQFRLVWPGMLLVLLTNFCILIICLLLNIFAVDVL